MINIRTIYKYCFALPILRVYNVFYFTHYVFVTVVLVLIFISELKNCILFLALLLIILASKNEFSKQIALITYHHTYITQTHYTVQKIEFTLLSPITLPQSESGFLSRRVMYYHNFVYLIALIDNASGSLFYSQLSFVYCND